MPQKMGRPTDSPKTHREAFRLSDSDMEKLLYVVSQTGMTKTDVIIKGIDMVYQKELRKK